MCGGVCVCGAVLSPNLDAIGALITGYGFEKGFTYLTFLFVFDEHARF